jgi:hypothetical protein
MLKVRLATTSAGSGGIRQTVGRLNEFDPQVANSSSRRAPILRISAPCQFFAKPSLVKVGSERSPQYDGKTSNSGVASAAKLSIVRVACRKADTAESLLCSAGFGTAACALPARMGSPQLLRLSLE